MTIDFHRLALADFDDLAAGGGRTGLVLALRRTQLSKRLLALHAVLTDATERAPEAAADSGLANAYWVIAAAQRQAPRAIETILLSPGLGLWAMHCLRRLHGRTNPPTSLEEDLGILGAFAVAAALRASLHTTVTVPLRGGNLRIPGVGQVQIGLTGWATVHIEGTRLRLTTGAADSATITLEPPVGPPAATPSQTSSPTHAPADQWRMVPRLVSVANGRRIALQLDDVDPARLLLDLPMTAGTVTENVDVWQQRLDAGWRILGDYDPLIAEAVAAGLATIFPLAPSPWAEELSASSGEAFGAVALTLPRDGLSFAAALVHEFQHTKLSALLDLVTLFEPAEERLFYAPWRRDPRPLPGLLQGAYAYLGLTGFWDYRRLAENGDEFAHFEFARWREEVWRVLSTLRLSGAMTGLGLRFLDGMQANIWARRQKPVPDGPGRLARQACDDTRITWRLRNAEPAPTKITILAQAWIEGSQPSQSMRIPSRILPGNRGLVTSSRFLLIHLRLLDPKRFEAARQGVPHVLDAAVSAADQALAFGDARDAARAYKEELAREPDRLDAWAGLALCRGLHPTPGSPALTTRPEVVHRLHRRIEELSGIRADPDELVSWLPSTIS
ncbi:HEXXH motif domain-containing protein [Frankia sp. Mgl5]|uniref:HEXXH motif domain-containing protein n=1 Tax=Frankia sp. Mgl5 TaxID=2933793 RepID=UPI0020102859|nr:HEXXH motif domain-containing protein [Frankia sp. Mgl5]MCK9930340.1 HEXXH motif domain-containing protein [Frankia sp. Mgl5]